MALIGGVNQFAMSCQYFGYKNLVNILIFIWIWSSEINIYGFSSDIIVKEEKELKTFDNLVQGNEVNEDVCNKDGQTGWDF